MPTPAPLLRAARPLALALALFAAPALGAQSVSVQAGHGDSTWIVPRAHAADAPASLTTRDGRVALVLMDTTLVLQFTDAGLDQFHRQMRDSLPQGFGARLAAQMVGAALGTMFDHGIATPLASLREARVEGGRFVLEDRGGHRRFEHVELDGRDVMSDFAPAEAARFAGQVNRALGR